MRLEGGIFPFWLVGSPNGIRTGKRRFVFLTIPLLLISAILTFYSIKTLSYLSQQCPDVMGFYHFKPMISSKVYSDDGRLIHQFFIENRTPISLDEVSQHLKNAIIAVEDSRFYEHRGIDLKGIVRAYLRNLRTGKVAEGGSTITQQIVRTILLDTETTLSRKIKEALLAWRLERRFSKEQILEKYLNQVYFGSGAWGVESAAQTYFGKSASNLNLEESAFLAGLVQSPNIYYPYGDATKAIKRRKHVLLRMADQGMISFDEALEASRKPLYLKSKKVSKFANYFIEYIRRILEERYGTRRLFQRGLRIHTTLDIEMQEVAEDALRDGLLNL
ncbi:MAG: transglycosylase domain-containing protein, partial [Thermodesulfobacteriota bacterium]